MDLKVTGYSHLFNKRMRSASLKTIYVNIKLGKYEICEATFAKNQK